jgi:CBS domain-containing protein
MPSIKFKEIMSRDIDVVSPETTLRDAAERMHSLDVGVLPVCKDDCLVGVITDRDITVRATADGLDPFATQVGEIMSKDDLITCGEDEDVDEAARMMRDRQVRRLPVLNQEHRLVGILSLGDVAIDEANPQVSAGTLKEISRPS